MLKFSANLSMLFTEVGLVDRFQAAKQCGFDAVEIQFPYSLNPEAIAEKLAECDLKLVLFNVDADDLLQGGEGLACVPEKKQQFKVALNQAVEYAQILKPVAVNVLPGRCMNKNKSLISVRLYAPEGTELVEGRETGFSDPLREYLDIFKQNLRLAADALTPLGVKTVFEAINTYDMPGFIIHNSAQMLEILAELSHPNLYMQHDIYHMTRMGEDCAAFISRHADKIGHIQFADVPGRGQPGTGEIDFDKIFEVIRYSDYNGWCGAEYKPQGKTRDSFGWLKRINH